MFPILVTMYVKLARREEREVLQEFGPRYAVYAAVTPAFIPRLGQAPSGDSHDRDDSLMPASRPRSDYGAQSGRTFTTRRYRRKGVSR